QGYNDFITLLTQSIGMEKIALIHLNDTKQKCGSRIDQHCAVGEGSLSSRLRLFAAEKKLRHVPMVMELPVLQEKKEKEIFNLVKNWRI
ncbi:unnamed protein product, partial [marine sediment metagenome]